MSARELFEEDARAYANCAITYGTGFFKPKYSADERAVVDARTPAAIITIRAATEDAERQLREAHPVAASLHDQGVAAITDRAYAALSADETATLNRLRWLADVAQRLNQAGAMTPQDWAWLDEWPEGLDAPKSAELRQIWDVTAAAIERCAEHNRERGRQLLDDVASGKAWARLAAGQ